MRDTRPVPREPGTPKSAEQPTPDRGAEYREVVIFVAVRKSFLLCLEGFADFLNRSVLRLEMQRRVTADE